MSEIILWNQNSLIHVNQHQTPEKNGPPVAQLDLNVSQNLSCAFARIRSTTQGKHPSVVSTAPLPKPNIKTNKANPTDSEDSVALMCEPRTQNTAYLWRINDQSLSEEDRLKLSEDNRTLTLLSVVRTETGPYECEPGTQWFRCPDHVPLKYSFPLKDKPYISCHSDANPPAQYSSFVNGELQSSSQEFYISNINTNNSGSYTCLAYNCHCPQ
ncbi:cell adhesion molecule CEACAM6-like [Peromyscus maniculatus bairdii]|uniref:cell adhesion molecule CEACAM6-like n=1 Tax=Peromyscus maniculatus bairdii TaxID=230844 RepID=UPI003FCFFBE1